MSAEITFSGIQILKFLNEIGRRLEDPKEIVVVGLSGASLRFGYDDLASHISVASHISLPGSAIETTQLLTGLAITLQQRAEHIHLRGLDCRLEEVQQDVRTSLKISIPDPVDLILLALAEVGLDQLVMIERLVKFNGITANEILERFERDAEIAEEWSSQIHLNLHMILEYCYANSIGSERVQ